MLTALLVKHPQKPQFFARPRPTFGNGLRNGQEHS